MIDDAWCGNDKDLGGAGGRGGGVTRGLRADIVTVFRVVSRVPPIYRLYIGKQANGCEEVDDEARNRRTELVECWEITPRFLSSGREFVCRI